MCTAAQAFLSRQGQLPGGGSQKLLSPRNVAGLQHGRAGLRFGSADLGLQVGPGLLMVWSEGQAALPTKGFQL